MTPEETAIANLRERLPALPAESMDFLRRAFQKLREIEDGVARTSPGQLPEAMWAFFGVMARSYQLMICCIDQLAAKNFNGYYASLRALIESLCAIIWAGSKPARWPSLVQSVSLKLGPMLNAGYKKYPDLQALYADLSSIVHPGRSGHLLTPRRNRTGEDKGLYSPFELDFSETFARVKLKLLVQTSARVVDEFYLLSEENDGKLLKGKIMATWVHRRTTR